MAKKQTFLLLSLSDSKAKKLAEVIQNNTCRKILEALSEKSATETELSKALEIPLPTVHYNLKHLVEAKLVKDDEYHYSSKGKEVTHYTLAKQFVIIAPEGATEGLREKLKTLLPTFTIIGAAALAIKLFSDSFSTSAQEAPTLLMKAAMPAAGAGEPVMETAADASMEGARLMAAPAPEQFANAATATTTAVSTSAPLWAWFVIGAISALAVYLIADKIIKKIQEEKE
jgi:DNA-binding transcriptional ArsR family regulator